MRFLLVAAQYLPTIGGVERYTHSLAAALRARGHGVLVLTGALPGQPQRQREESGAEVLRLPARGWLAGRFPVPKKNARFRRLAQQLFSAPCDFMLINNRFYLLSLWAAKQAKKRGIPALVLDHSTAHLSLANPLADRFVALYEHFAARLARRRCPHFYGVSRACGQWLGHYGIEAEGVLYNAVDAARLRALADAVRRDFRRENGLAPAQPLIVFSGRLVREKGVWELLAAFSLVRRRLPEAALILAGEGAESAALRRQKTPGTLFCGPLPHADNLALLAQAEVFCLPSYSEGFSTAVLEAAALGACVVTTPTGGSAELIEDGVSGLLLKDTAPETIAAALLRALGGAAWRKGACRAAEAALNARFTWDKTAQALEEIALRAYAGPAQRQDET